MGNTGYQEADKDIVNYDLWNPAGTALWLRGPKIDIAKSYFVCIGAAQTFGRFCREPYPNLLAKKIKLQALNFGFSGAGPKYFDGRDKAVNLINKSKFAVVQFFSGRSVENSVFSLGINQGIVIWKSGPKAGERVVAEFGYRELIERSSAEELIKVRDETRRNYVGEMIALLKTIEVPKILLFFSQRKPAYREGLDEIGQYWGEFPHFVNQNVIDQIVPHADAYVEVVTKRGLPQPLYKIGTTEPAIAWPPDKFPHVQLRSHNNYYPSPEMHEDVASALTGKLRTLGLIKG